MARPWKAVLFDAGNTLIHVDFVRVAEALGRHGAPCRAEDLVRAELHARMALDTAEVIARSNDRDRWWSYFGLICERVGIADAAVRDAVLHQLRDDHRSRNLWNRLAEGASETLAALRARGLRIGLVSNSDGSIGLLAEQLGLAPHFETIVDSHAVGVEKPDPRIFAIALERMGGLAPEECVYVGDLYHVDVVGAERAGMTPVLIDPGSLHADKPCRRIRGLDELEGCLTRGFEN